MPSPIRIGNRYYLRIRTPRDLIGHAMGRTIHLPVDGVWRPVKIGSVVKLSLETADHVTAKARHAETSAALQSVWQAMRSSPAQLTHKQMYALAGEIYRALVDAFDEEPGPARLWANVLQMDSKARSGQLHPLRIGGTGRARIEDMERRFGPFVDIKLAQKGISLSPEQRPTLLQIVAGVIEEAAIVNLRKAGGDYADSGEPAKYPVFIATPLPSSTTDGCGKNDARAGNALAGSGLTFSSVIDEEIRRRSGGKDAVPMRETSVKKFRAAVSDFVAFRGSDDATTVTAREADTWKMAMLEKAVLSNNSIKQRLQNVRTVLEWARLHSLGDLYPNGNPFTFVKAPAYQPVASDARTFTMEEAATTLLAARNEKAPELRWLPWLCAYSGARINEVAQLTKSDFFQVGEDWFYRLTTAGGKTLKNRYSIRNVPVHPVLVEEGLLRFLETVEDADRRLFPKRSQPNISEWLRNKVGISRKELAPNHGWRHLFEDQCINGGVIDAARNYITGRSTGKSSEGYGKSQAMLPGLAKEMRKVPPIPLPRT